MYPYWYEKSGVLRETILRKTFLLQISQTPHTYGVFRHFSTFLRRVPGRWRGPTAGLRGGGGGAIPFLPTVVGQTSAFWCQKSSEKQVLYPTYYIFFRLFPSCSTVQYRTVRGVS